THRDSPNSVIRIIRLYFASEIVGPREQADTQIVRHIDLATVELHGGIGDAHHQLAHDDPLEVYAIGHQLAGRQHLAGELDLARTERTATAGTAHPAQI